MSECDLGQNHEKELFENILWLNCPNKASILMASHQLTAATEFSLSLLKPLSMTKHLPLTFVLIFAGLISYAQCEGGRYTEFIFPSWEKSEDIVYGENINVDGVNEELKMDVYVPAGDISTSRALIVICHGGYFLYGDKGEMDVVPFCEDLSKMGYVVASINYRMGIEFESPLNAPYGRAVVRAVQDLRAAIRWFRKDAAENNQFGIDPDQIYTGGDSAGGFMAIHHAYMDEDEIPEYIDLTAEGLEGGLEGNSGNSGFSSHVNAIFNISGAIGDTTWIDADELPACLFHGDADGTVPFDSDTFYLFGLAPVVELDGSNPIDQKLTQLGIEHCFEINEGLGHVPYLGNDAVYDTTLSILTGFLSHFICGSELTCGYEEIVEGVETLGMNKIKISPNPATNIITINPGKNVFAQLEITDATGRFVKSINQNFPGQIDISDLSPGLYLFQFQMEGEIISTKVVVD